MSASTALFFLYGCFSSYDPTVKAGDFQSSSLEMVEVEENPRIDDDGDGLTAEEGDCDDNDPTISPYAEELCDEIDNNCNGMIDEGVMQFWWQDNDNDGYGTEENPFYGCAAPSGYTDNQLDCDDSNSSVFPASEEICNGIDDDCNGIVDDGLDILYYRDADGDGYGDAYQLEALCEETAGYVSNKIDCDDGDPGVHPYADEYCDGYDNNCNYQIDENAVNTITWYVDGDQDGFGGSSSLEACLQPEGYVSNNSDCNDGNPNQNPTITEICNQLDDDCNGDIDDNPADGSPYYADTDQDGFGSLASPIISCNQPSGYLVNALDCNDNNPNINPNSSEICDGLDNDCDTLIDDDDSSIVTSTQTIWSPDNDADGFGSPGSSIRSCVQPAGYVANSTDCNDAQANTFPNAPEICDDVDNDCNGAIDDNAIGASLWFADNDGDGFGGNTSQQSCDQPNGFVATSGDCDDNDAQQNPAAVERCNVEDDDCDGSIDESAVDASLWFADNDSDGFGGNISQRACTQPSGYVSISGDCDDTTAIVNPNQNEICDGLDNDCDSLTDDADNSLEPSSTTTWFIDNDSDGFGGITSVQACNQPNGFVTNTLDCNDADSLINPNAIEICDNVDQNCNGAIDDNAIGASLWFADNDGDGFGGNTSQQSCDQPNGFVATSGDCDDNDAQQNPAAVERCNVEDDDCDGSIDESAVDASLWFADNDSDGFGGNTSQLACSQPSGYVSISGDCDDTTAIVNPNQNEICDGLDNDCDSLTDDADNSLEPSSTTTWFIDNDSDGFGGSTSVQACNQPNGFVTNTLDCNDADSLINPSAIEICDNVDQNCNGDIDDNAVDATTYFADTDGDGFGGNTSQQSCDQPNGFVATSGDCDDSDAQQNPAAVERCNVEDDDCDGSIDENAVDAILWFADNDSDGFGGNTSQLACSQPSGYVSISGDCDDTTAIVNPNQNEICDGLDNDCDSLTDDADNSLEPSSTTTWFIDNDSDGFGGSTSVQACNQPNGFVTNTLDCNDADSLINPNAIEICDNVDQNCNGDIDDNAVDATTYFADTDGDGFGGSTSQLACSQPSGFVTSSSDCNDNDPSQNPGAVEVCNQQDDDCNGSIDDGAIDPLTWFSDADDDGFGSNVSTLSCQQPAGFVSNSTDCDDTLATINPNAIEICDNIDNDCDNLIDDDDDNLAAGAAPSWFRDGDQDGFGSPLNTQDACIQPAGFVSNSSDCDDGDSLINPSAIEICDNIDQNCDGSIDENAVDASTYFADNDGDGFGGSTTTLACSLPANHQTTSTDCDDTNPSINPNAIEICDSLDNDCDNDIDDADNSLDQSTTTTWFRDSDQDGFGSPLNTLARCTQPAGYLLNNTDCDDTSVAINPNATEVCDTLDNDCDTRIDDDDNSLSLASTTTWGADRDGDNFGDDLDTVQSCNAPSGYVVALGDCDDDDATINPDATEECDGIDQDCDNIIDSADSCPCNFETFEDSSYLYCTSGFSWNIARLLCDSANYHLLSINSESEDEWVFTTVNDYSGSGTKWWIGLNDIGQEGTFVWDNGDPFVYDNWNPAEPNNSGNNEDCGQINRYNDGTWNDEPCTTSLPFVCEVNP